MTPLLMEFESPSAALIAKPVPIASRYVTWIIASMFLAAMIVMTTMKIDRVVSSTGKVVAIANNVVVQPLETSIVRSIDVKEGQVVRKGELLARLDPTFTAADAGALHRLQIGGDARLGDIAVVPEPVNPRPRRGRRPDELRRQIIGQQWPGTQRQ